MALEGEPNKPGGGGGGGGWSAAQWTQMIVMYPSYMSALFSRATMDACLPAMLADAALQATTADVAALLSTGVAFYSVGKLLGGICSALMLARTAGVFALMRAHKSGGGWIVQR